MSGSVDYRKVLKAYMEVVGLNEGTDFLPPRERVKDSWEYKNLDLGKLTDEELGALYEVAGEPA